MGYRAKPPPPPPLVWKRLDRDQVRILPWTFVIGLFVAAVTGRPFVMLGWVIGLLIVALVWVWPHRPEAPAHMVDPLRAQPCNWSGGHELVPVTSVVTGEVLAGLCLRCGAQTGLLDQMPVPPRGPGAVAPRRRPTPVPRRPCTCGHLETSSIVNYYGERVRQTDCLNCGGYPPT